MQFVLKVCKLEEDKFPSLTCWINLWLQSTRNAQMRRTMERTVYIKNEDDTCQNSREVSSSLFSVDILIKISCKFTTISLFFAQELLLDWLMNKVTDMLHVVNNLLFRFKGKNFGTHTTEMYELLSSCQIVYTHQTMSSRFTTTYLNSRF